MLPRSDETRTNEALESATSLPDPIAIDTSAAARACITVNYIKSLVVFVVRTHRSVVNSISNHGHNTAAVQSSPRQPP